MNLFYYIVPGEAHYFVLASSTIQAAAMINRQMKRDQTGKGVQHRDVGPYDVQCARYGEVVTSRLTYAGVEVAQEFIRG